MEIKPHYPPIRLHKGKEVSLIRKHPWVFSGAIKSKSPDVTDGRPVSILGPDDSILGTGHYSEGSIAIRILSFENSLLDKKFFKEKLRNAMNLRRRLNLMDNPETDAYRLIHGEGDFLPGLVIDIYANVAVIQPHSSGMERSVPDIEAALQELYGDLITRIHTKGIDRGKSKSELEAKETNILENGNRFLVNYSQGQKTGFFLDQRDNRLLLSNYVKDKKVLNAFSYSGAFSIYALKAGAKSVHSLDSSKQATELVEKNILLNKIDVSRHRILNMDAMSYLKSNSFEDADYDVVVLDPPAFAKHKSARHRAIQAYKRLNQRAFEVLKPGSILFTFSCSQVVTSDLFLSTVTAAAIETGKNIRILDKLRQPPDHPVSIYHPESEYLKGLVLEIEN